VTGVEYTVARDDLEGRLGKKAFEHCVAVAETAGELAEVYEIDVEQARLAGLLHDWAREMTAEELLGAADTHDIEITDVDTAVPYLLHAKAGAAEVRAAYPDLDLDVARAVELHTMGSASMADLDKVVYVADMIEPSRSFRGVEELREAAGKVSLDELFVQAYARSVIRLIERRRHIHPETLKVWNTLVAEERT
jgi:predicted HD superfamily hydrolase involved in NAD metabolism